MSHTLPKYLVSLKVKKRGLSVASPTPLEAAILCFPDRKVEEVARGHQWVQFKVTPAIDLKWPDDKMPKLRRGKTDCNILDVETVGEILIP